MPAYTGFFTREQVTAPRRRVRDPGLTADQLHRLGLAGVERMNPEAKHPNILPTGSNRPDLLVLGEAPGTAEDSEGKPFVGPSGRMVRRLLPEGLRVRFDNVCRTYPPLRGGQHTPNRTELECFRPTVASAIAEAKPKVVLAVGGISAAWCLGPLAAKAGITALRGRSLPARIGGHACWVYPIIHPAAILREEGPEEHGTGRRTWGGGRGVAGAEAHRYYWEQDVRRAIAGIDRPPPVIESDDPLTTNSGIELEWKSPSAVAAFLGDLQRAARPFTLDTETTFGRPYAPGAKILTAAVGTPERTLAFPIDHPQARWTKAGRDTVIEAMGKLLASRLPRIAHNACFDLEYLIHFFGMAAAWAGPWHDTMGQAYMLDERQRTLSLDYLCLQHFGLPLKTVEEIDLSKLASTPLETVLQYNGRDTKYTARLYEAQKRCLDAIGQWKPYLLFVRRVVPMAVAQLIGIPVDQEVNRRLQDRAKQAVDETLRAFLSLPELQDYRERFGPYKDSIQCNIRLFGDVLGMGSAIRQKGGGYSTKDEVISEIDHPVPKALLDLREASKLKNTYVDRLSDRHPKTFVFADGKIHPRYKACGTDTRRTATGDPAVQNQPRTHKWVKEQYRAPEDCICLFADYGAQEARIIAILSEDENLVRFLNEGHDFHMAWAKRIYEAYPDSCEERYGRLDENLKMKEWRQEVKANWDFAGFYLASIETRARKLGLPVEIAARLDGEFWDEFFGVKRWQEREIRRFGERGYVTSLLGGRLHGPKNESMIVNAPVQASGADMTCDAWYRLGKMAYETDRPWLHMPLMVHDDLTSFYIPRAKEEEATEAIARTMCFLPYPWANVVPIVVEISRGPDWGHKGPLWDGKGAGEFSSKTFDADLARWRMATAEARLLEAV